MSASDDGGIVRVRASRRYGPQADLAPPDLPHFTTELVNASIPDLLRAVERRVRPGVNNMVRGDARIRNALPVAHAEDPGAHLRVPALSGNALRSWGADRHADPGRKFERAHELLAGPGEAPAYDSAHAVERWSEIESHIGWRDAHQAAYEAVMKIFRDISAETHEAIENNRDEDVPPIAWQWLTGEISTYQLLAGDPKRPQQSQLAQLRRARDAHAEDAVPLREPEIWRAGNSDFDAANRSYMAGKKALMASYADGFDRGVHELAALFDEQIARITSDWLPDALTNLESAGLDIQLQWQSNWDDGAKAKELRAVASEAIPAGDAAFRAVGKLPQMWEEALKCDEGRMLLARIGRMHPHILAVHLADDFDTVLKQFEQLPEAVMESRAEAVRSRLTRPQREEVASPVLVEATATHEPLEHDFAIV